MDLMTARGGFLSSDAVGIIAGQGDRLDKLERTLPAIPGNDLVASYFPMTDLPGDGTHVFVGRLTLPRGYSKLTVAAFFEATDGSDVLAGVGIDFPAGFEEDHVLVGGFTTVETEAGFAFRASGEALLRSPARRTYSFAAHAFLADHAHTSRGTGVLFLEPVGSIAAS